MDKYKRVRIECYTYLETIHIYETNYKEKYQLIGYRFNSIDHVGELVLFRRR